jgi:hypothetical protein
MTTVTQDAPRYRRFGPNASDRDVLAAFTVRGWGFVVDGDTMHSRRCSREEPHVVLYSHGVPIAFRAISGHGGVVFDERPGGRRLGRIMAHARRATAAVQEAGCPVEIVDHDAFVERCERIGAGR